MKPETGRPEPGARLRLRGRIPEHDVARKYSRENQRLLAVWAADCALRVLPFFEKAYPDDERPRKAIKACRAWARTGVFRMADIRGASLAAHAAARRAKRRPSACLAARSAGHAVATAHVPQHAFGAAGYALKAVLAAFPATGEGRAERERRWQASRLASGLRREFLKRVVTRRERGRIRATVCKDRDF